MKELRLIKMCITETCSRVRLNKYLPHIFPVRNGLQQDAVSPFYFYFALEYAIRRVSRNPGCLKLNSRFQLLVYANSVNIMGGSVYTLKNVEALVMGIKETGVEANSDKTMYIIMS